MGETNSLFCLSVIFGTLCLCVARSSAWKLGSVSTSWATLKMMKTRNMYQCERLCLRFKPCESVSYSIKTRVCSLFIEELTDNHIGPSRESILSDMPSNADVSASCPTGTVLAASGDSKICLVTSAAGDCQEILESVHTAPDGLYMIRPQGSHLLKVYCDMTDDGGGWTVLQRRTDGSETFYRSWQEYKDGFGNLENEFWLGNDNIYRLTNKKHSHLKVVMEDFEHNQVYASYSTFRVEDERDNYRLTIGGYNGTAGDSLAIQNNMAFSTKDVDNDLSVQNCAQLYQGAWWYQGCHQSNLNGEYNSTVNARGVTWLAFRGHGYSLKFVEMKSRSKPPVTLGMRSRGVPSRFLN